MSIFLPYSVVASCHWNPSTRVNVVDGGCKMLNWGISCSYLLIGEQFDNAAVEKAEGEERSSPDKTAILEWEAGDKEERVCYDTIPKVTLGSEQRVPRSISLFSFFGELMRNEHAYNRWTTKENIIPRNRQTKREKVGEMKKKENRS
eukprot:TCALIF_09708-PA protein Name:"Protein of unknown function" AED:0.45 eAED:1.00 QI:0/0/0/1/1/1/2/0/146